MVFHARFDSPLGPVLLCSEHDQLTGLYFIGQKDCPPVGGCAPGQRLDGLPAEDVAQARPGLDGGTMADATRSGTVIDTQAANAADPADPTSGTQGGMPIRRFKVRRRGLNDGLFSPDNIMRTHASPPGPAVEPDAVALGPLEVIQNNAPAAACQLFSQAHRQLHEYFNGARTAFSVPMLLQGTAFQQRVWEALLAIPYGEYVSYGDIALAAGLTPQHGRPVGRAVGQNPITIMVPCHRVLSGAGRLNGYTGGLERKLALLELEGFEAG